ncbi:MAG: Tryptophan RNA-binding attenuator protein inhibitory protein [Acidobacteriota bacterium]|jgi:DnaJ-class molecular chaperone|nr:Tryptophan RNA-binding attenuator protein inhibitory protein [Acidobacteriota bacterium]
MEIKIDDLIETCTSCEGTGRLRPDDPYSRVNVCNACHEWGKQLTEAGKVLKQFIDEVKKAPLP